MVSRSAIWWIRRSIYPRKLEGDIDGAEALGSENGGTLLEQLVDARKLKYPAVGKKPYRELQRICQ
jgi:hypothetical protein